MRKKILMGIVLCVMGTCLMAFDAPAGTGTGAGAAGGGSAGASDGSQERLEEEVPEEVPGRALLSFMTVAPENHRELLNALAAILQSDCVTGDLLSNARKSAEAFNHKSAFPFEHESFYKDFVEYLVSFYIPVVSRKPVEQGCSLISHVLFFYFYCAGTCFQSIVTDNLLDYLCQQNWFSTVSAFGRCWSSKRDTAVALLRAAYSEFLKKNDYWIVSLLVDSLKELGVFVPDVYFGLPSFGVGDYQKQ